MEIIDVAAEEMFYGAVAVSPAVVRIRPQIASCGTSFLMVQISYRRSSHFL
jgi:hypothetical protein